MFVNQEISRSENRLVEKNAVGQKMHSVGMRQKKTQWPDSGKRKSNRLIPLTIGAKFCATLQNIKK